MKIKTWRLYYRRMDDNRLSIRGRATISNLFRIV